MKKQFNKIDIPDKLPEIYPIKVKFDNQDYLYDFSLHVNNEISRFFAKVFYVRNSSLSHHTRERNFGSINKFLKFIEEKKISKITDITPILIIAFATWLDTQNFALNTKYHHYNTVENSLYDIKKISEKIKDLEIPVNPFKDPNSERELPNKLSGEQLKQVLKICYEKVDNLMANFRLAQQKIEEVNLLLQSGGEFNWKDKYHIIQYFFQKYGYVPFSTEINHHENEMFRNIGGVNHLLNAITPDVHMLLPFYLILMIELAANSDALRQIEIDCVNEDPLFEDRCFIVWNKGRSKDVQKRNVFKNKKYGAYEIINLLKEFTQHTRNRISEEEKKFLFICRGESAKKQLLLAHDQSFKLAVKLFCKENNLEFKFNPSDIRPTVLTEFYKKRKDIVSVSKIANHKFIDTTLLYVVDEETKKENRAYLSEKQDNIISEIFKTKVDKEDIKIQNAKNIGFECKNPIVDKKVCINWMAELTNTELIIPDSPIYLSRIIALENAVIKTEKTMDKERFELLYQPILHVIQKEIKPKFSEKTIKESIKLAEKLELPILGDY